MLQSERRIQIRNRNGNQPSVICSLGDKYEFNPATDYLVIPPGCKAEIYRRQFGLKNQIVEGKQIKNGKPTGRATTFQIQDDAQDIFCWEAVHTESDSGETVVDVYGNDDLPDDDPDSEWDTFLDSIEEDGTLAEERVIIIEDMENIGIRG